MAAGRNQDIKELQEKADHIKSTMEDNLDKLLERGKILSQLEEHAANKLAKNAKQLKEEAKELYFQARWNEYSLYAIVAGGALGLGVGLIAGLSSLVTLVVGAIGCALGYGAGWLYTRTLNVSTEQNHRSKTKTSTEKVTKNTSTPSPSLTFMPSFHHKEAIIASTAESMATTQVTRKNRGK